jgi:hypothetical protein
MLAPARPIPSKRESNCASPTSSNYTNARQMASLKHKANRTALLYCTYRGCYTADAMDEGRWEKRRKYCVSPSVRVTCAAENLPLPCRDLSISGHKYGRWDHYGHLTLKLCSPRSYVS